MKIRRRERLGILGAAVLALFVIALPGTASAKDQNRDKIPDRWERSHKLSLQRDQRKLDQDSDGLKNRGEWLAGTNPRDKDSDNDGTSDLKEKAGVISAYDEETGELTLTLYAGGELTGSVTDETRVRCEAEDAAEDEGADDGTDDQGSGDAESRHGGPGPDRGEAGDDSGDQSGVRPGSDDQSNDGSEDQGHGNPGRDMEGGCGGDCSVDDLAEGVEVTEAVIKYTASGKVFRELEIVASADE